MEKCTLLARAFGMTTRMLGGFAGRIKGGGSNGDFQPETVWWWHKGRMPRGLQVRSISLRDNPKENSTCT